MTDDTHRHHSIVFDDPDKYGSIYIKSDFKLVSVVALGAMSVIGMEVKAPDVLDEASTACLLHIP